MANILHTVAPIKKGDTIIHKCSRGIFIYKVIKTNETKAINVLIEHRPYEVASIELEDVRDI